MSKIAKYMTTTACLFMATGALAQTSSEQGSTDGTKSADTIKCADIITMDTAVVPGVLYFVAGHQEGSKAGMNNAASDGSQTMSDTGTSDTMASDTTASGTDSGTSGSATADSSGSLTTDTTGVGVTDTTGLGATGTTDSGATGTTDTLATGTDTTTDTALDDATTDSATTDSTMTDSATAGATDGSDMGDQMRIMRVAGLYEIPVEEVMTVCNQTPDENVSDVVEQNARDNTANTN